MRQNILAILSLSLLTVSCNDKEIFEQEMFENRVALISSSYHNNFEESFPLRGEEVNGYIAASVGGSYAPKQDITIQLEEENTAFDRYNWSLYDADSSRYARLLPKSNYHIPEYSLTIKAGERTGKTLIHINPNGLSPDSTYFISLQAVEQTHLLLNPNKKNVLYKVTIFNDYASQATNSVYTMTGLQDGAITAANKQLFPLSNNSVRVIAGTESFANTLESIANTAMVLTVNDDNSIIISPYKNLDIQQIDGDSRYPNKFHIEESFGRKFNVFNIAYKYKIGKTEKIMQEQLRMEVQP